MVRSITTRVRNKFNVSVAEVDDNHLWQLVTLGITCVSNDTHHVNEVLSRVVGYIDAIRGDAEMVDFEMEFLHAL